MTTREQAHMHTVLSLQVRGLQGDKYAAFLARRARGLYSPRVWLAIERAAANVARIRVA